MMNKVVELPRDVSLRVHDRAMLDADSVEEAGKYLRTFGVTDEHIQFLAGIGGLPKLRELYFQAIRFDLERGTKTTEFIPEAEMQRDAREHPKHFAGPADSVKDGVKHRPSLTSVIRRGIDSAIEILRDKYGIDPSDASFFDLGTGTGKPLIIAGQDYDFAQATGIDYNKPLVSKARKNLRAAGLDTRSDIRAMFANASEFRRFNGTNVVFMYNPFLKPVMTEVEKNLRKNGGKTIVVYNKPLFEGLFSEKKGWRIEGRFTVGDRGEKTFDADHELLIVSRGFDRHEINNPTPSGEVKSPVSAPPELVSN